MLTDLLSKDRGYGAADKLGLVVIDASTAKQEQGPSVSKGGQLVKMDLIISGTNPLSTEMVTANIMRFQPEEISTFVWTWKAAMTLVRLDEIEVRGVRVSDIRQKFLRPTVVPWSIISEYRPPC